MKRNFKHVRSSFMFTLISQILGVVFSILLVSFMIIGFMITSRMKDEINHNTMLSFQKTEYELDSLFNEAASMINHLFTSDETNNYLHIDSQDALTKIQTLINIKNMMERTNIKGFDLIGIMNDDSHAVMMTDSEFLSFDHNDKGYTSLAHLPNKHAGNALWYDYIELDDLLYIEAVDTNFIYVARHMNYPYVNSFYSCTIFAGISQESLAHTYQQIQGDDNRVTIINENGRILSSKDPAEFGNVLPYYTTLLKHEGSFNHTIDGTKYRIIPYRLDKFGWTIINLVPVKVYMSKVNSFMYVMIGICSICFILIAVLCIIQVKRIFKPFYALKTSMDSLAEGNLASQFTYSTDISEIKDLGNDFNRMAGNISAFIDKEKDYIEQKNNLRMQVLIAQINPHFIHNTLNLIKWMAMIGGNDNIMNMTGSMINILAPGFKNKHLSWSIQEETSFIREYINILDIRFGGDAQFDFHVDEGLSPYSIPRFIIQPLIENAITHGYTQDMEFMVEVSMIEKEKNIQIIVSDNGVGIEEKNMDTLLSKIHNSGEHADNPSGIGLINIKERLALFYKDNYTFIIDDTIDVGTRILIEFPIK